MSVFRKPKGTYARNTPDWFVAQQCFASSLTDLSSAAPQVIGAAQSNSNTCNVPAGAIPGDLIFFTCGSGSPAAPTVGSWTLLIDNSGIGGDPATYWKYVQKGDPSSLTSSSASVITGTNIVVVRGGATAGADPFDVLASGTTAANPVVAPIVTPTTGTVEIYLLWLQTHIFNVLSATPGFTELSNISDAAHGNSPGMSLGYVVGSTAFAAASTAYTHPILNGAQWQQALIARTTFSLYASLYNNATDGSVLYVTDLEVEFDAEDSLQISLVSGADQVPYAGGFGCFATNPSLAAPVGQLFSVPSSQLVAFLLDSPPTIKSYRADPPTGSYLAVLPPGYGLAVASGANIAKRMASRFNYIVLPN